MEHKRMATSDDFVACIVCFREPRIKISLKQTTAITNKTCIYYKYVFWVYWYSLISIDINCDGYASYCGRLSKIMTSGVLAAWVLHSSGSHDHNIVFVRRTVSHWNVPRGCYSSQSEGRSPVIGWQNRTYTYTFVALSPSWVLYEVPIDYRTECIIVKCLS